MRKRIRTAIAAVLMSALGAAAGGFAPAGQAYSLGQAPIELDGRVLDTPAQIGSTSVSLPVRCVCQALGYGVSWSDTGGVQTITIARDGDVVVLELYSQRITDNGHRFSAAVLSGDGIRLVNGRAYMDSGLFGTVFPVTASYDGAGGRVRLRLLDENSVSVLTETLTSDDRFLAASIQYPQLLGIETDIRDAINSKLKAAADGALAAGRKNAADMAEAVGDGYTGAVGNCETFFDYFTAYNREGLYSVVLTEYQYSGGAHGATVQHAFTFGLETGKALRLGDIMDGDTGWREFVSESIRKEIGLRVRAGMLDEYESDKFTDIGAEPGFYLSNNALVVYFQQYEYFPYVSGIQEFGIDYADLANFIREDYAFLCGGMPPDAAVKMTAS